MNSLKQTAAAVAVCLLAVISRSEAAGTIAFEAVSVSIASSASTGTFDTITLQAQHNVVPIIIPIPTEQGGDPCNVRVKNITTTQFETQCLEPTGNDGTHIGMDVHYIAIEPGIHSIPLTSGGSVTIAAGCTDTSQTQHRFGTPATGWESISFGTVFSTPPIVIHNINSMNSETGTPPGGPAVPHLSTVIEGGSITTSGFNIALDRAESLTGTVVAEKVCWIAMEPQSCGTLDFGGGETVDFVAGNTDNDIDGWNNGCDAGEDATFGTCFSVAPVVVASRITNNGADGGWPRRCSLSATEARFTIDEDIDNDTERGHIAEQLSFMAFAGDFATTPITLSWFASRPHSSGVVIEWQTATETGNVGFDVEGLIDGAWQTLTVSPIASKVVNSAKPTDYVLNVAGLNASRLRLIDIDMTGRRTTHGPFEIDGSIGSRIDAAPIDWSSVSAVPQPELRLANGPHYAAANEQISVVGEVTLGVGVSGIQRVTYEQLLEAGFKLRDAPVRDIALLKGRTPVPIYVSSEDSRFGRGDYVEFVGNAIDDSLYTRERSYRLLIDSTRAKRMEVDRIKPANEKIPSWYRERRVIERDVEYSFSAPGDDPWFEQSMLTFQEPKTWNFNITVDNIAADAEAAVYVSAAMWGGTDFPDIDDHRAVISINDHEISDERFDGLEAHVVRSSFPTSVLRSGSNTLSVHMPADSGSAFTLVNMDRYGITYPRRFVARNGALSFHHSARAFRIRGFESNDIVAYRAPGADETRAQRILKTAIKRKTDGDYQIRFGSSPVGRDTYYLADASRVNRPSISGSVNRAPLFDHPVDFVVITHERFAGYLDTFVEAREAQGLNVEVVDVATIYRRYSSGVVNPSALRQYVRQLHRNNGLQYVLLVGGDTYDYHDNLRLGSVSFIPTLYTRTDDVVGFTPADALLGDIDGDRLAEVAVGRWPVRTLDELATVVDKTLRYDSRSADSTALFVADPGSDGQFFRVTDGIAEGLGTNWQIDKAYGASLTPAQSRQNVLDGLNAGPALVGFFGHSSPTQWTFDNLFSAEDVLSLTNDEPMVVSQWGCWNTYHVSPEYDTLGHSFLLAGSSGAAAVMGAATLTETSAEKLFGEQLVTEFATPGLRLGDAIMRARDILAQTRPDAWDVLVGWALLGDPTLSVKR